MIALFGAHEIPHGENNSPVPNKHMVGFYPKV